jgi:hypothetical protein
MQLLPLWHYCPLLISATKTRNIDINSFLGVLNSVMTEIIPSTFLFDYTEGQGLFNQNLDANNKCSSPKVELRGWSCTCKAARPAFPSVHSDGAFANASANACLLHATLICEFMHLWPNPEHVLKLYKAPHALLEFWSVCLGKGALIKNS